MCGIGAELQVQLTIRHGRVREQVGGSSASTTAGKTTADVDGTTADDAAPPAGPEDPAEALRRRLETEIKSATSTSLQVAAVQHLVDPTKSKARTSTTAENYKVKMSELLRNRGPDAYAEKKCISTSSLSDSSSRTTAVTHMFGSVLHLRGDKLVEQPVVLSDGSAFCFNGEIWSFDGKALEDPTVSDTDFLASRIERVISSGDLFDQALQDKILERIDGPFAFLHYCPKRARLFCMRDGLGRRSLCLSAWVVAAEDQDTTDSEAVEDHTDTATAHTVLSPPESEIDRPYAAPASTSSSRMTIGILVGNVVPHSTGLGSGVYSAASNNVVTKRTKSHGEELSEDLAPDVIELPCDGAVHIECVEPYGIGKMKEHTTSRRSALMPLSVRLVKRGRGPQKTQMPFESLRRSLEQEQATEFYRPGTTYGMEQEQARSKKLQCSRTGSVPPERAEIEFDTPRTTLHVAECMDDEYFPYVRGPGRGALAGTTTSTIAGPQCPNALRVPREVSARFADSLRRAVAKRVLSIPLECMPMPLPPSTTRARRVTVLFSGGLDSTVLAYLAAEVMLEDAARKAESDRHEVRVQLVNVSYSPRDSPDRVSCFLSFNELRTQFPKNTFELVLVDCEEVPETVEVEQPQEKEKEQNETPSRLCLSGNKNTAVQLAGVDDPAACSENSKNSNAPAPPGVLKNTEREHLRQLLGPSHQTHMDFNIGMSLWKACRGTSGNFLPVADSAKNCTSSTSSVYVLTDENFFDAASNWEELLAQAQSMLPADFEKRSGDRLEKQKLMLRIAKEYGWEAVGVLDDHEHLHRSGPEESPHSHTRSSCRAPCAAGLDCALYRSCRVDAETRMKDPKVILLGHGADEVLAGYARMKTQFLTTSTEGGCGKGKIALFRSTIAELDRFWQRNLGRDDRICSDHGKEVRHPYLDQDFLDCVAEHVVPKNCFFPDKIVLRQLAWQLGLVTAGRLDKRAIQFGCGIAKQSNKAAFGSNRKANGRAQYARMGGD